MVQPFSFSGSPPATEEIVLEHGTFEIRCADTRGKRSSSSALIERLYAWRGYKHDIAEEDRVDVNQVTLQACRNKEVFGTLTVRFDSEAGLAADALYREEIDAYRIAGLRVCELTRLAIDPEHGSKEVLGALFHLAHIYGTKLRGVTDVFIEVNPRHVTFYKRMLHFRQAGEKKMCPRVEAPAMLLHVETAHVAEQVLRYGGHQGVSRGSLYPYFFSPNEEAGLTNRIFRQAAGSGSLTPA
jgi:hypothetical protein